MTRMSRPVEKWKEFQNARVPERMSEHMSHVRLYAAAQMSEHLHVPAFTIDGVSEHARTSLRTAFVRIVCRHMCFAFFQVASQQGWLRVKQILFLFCRRIHLASDFVKKHRATADLITASCKAAGSKWELVDEPGPKTIVLDNYSSFQNRAGHQHWWQWLCCVCKAGDGGTVRP